MVMCFFLHHTGCTEYILVINRQQPRRWHHSGFVVLGRSLVKQNADREARRPFVHYVEYCYPRHHGYSCSRGFLFLGNQFLHHFIHSFNDDCPLGLMDPGFKGLEVLVLALPERDLPHQNWCAHIHLGNDIVHHNTGLVNLAVQPSSMSTVNRILMMRKR